MLRNFVKSRMAVLYEMMNNGNVDEKTHQTFIEIVGAWIQTNDHSHLKEDEIVIHDTLSCKINFIAL